MHILIALAITLAVQADEEAKWYSLNSLQPYTCSFATDEFNNGKPEGKFMVTVPGWDDEPTIYAFFYYRDTWYYLETFREYLCISDRWGKRRCSAITGEERYLCTIVAAIKTRSGIQGALSTVQSIAQQKPPLSQQMPPKVEEIPESFSKEADLQNWLLKVKASAVWVKTTEDANPWLSPNRWYFRAFHLKTRTGYLKDWPWQTRLSGYPVYLFHGVGATTFRAQRPEPNKGLRSVRLVPGLITKYEVDEGNSPKKEEIPAKSRGNLT